MAGVVGVSECRFGVTRKEWGFPFLAEAGELAGLRRVVRLHLNLWGLPELVQDAQLCVTELVTNVINHVGPGTPTTLGVSMNGRRLRLEVGDPDTRALPTLLTAADEEESGRGMALVDAVTDRWGVILRGDTKITWCELATGLRSQNGHIESPQVAKAEALLTLYCCRDTLKPCQDDRLSVAVAESAATDLIADLLHWLRAHGCDPDEALDRAQMHFEAEIKAA
ncbi:ATP-binding protein [Streptomyces sp. NPDC059134]|uniref:ATP-binding protein n=1 Tax=Streptomyces sp. NPDC059134 TaxID=3346738 RepID=UPI0036B45859